MAIHAARFSVFQEYGFSAEIRLIQAAIPDPRRIQGLSILRFLQSDDVDVDVMLEKKRTDQAG